LPDNRTLIFEALSERFASCGGYDYEHPEEMDETGAPWMSDNAVGISLDPSGTRSVELVLPEQEKADENWGWKLCERDSTLAHGELSMTWQKWSQLETGANAAPYRIGGRAAGELETELLDVAEGANV